MNSSSKVPTLSIPVEEAEGPFVLALDVGSTASRGGVYDRSGRPVKGSKQKIEHAFTTDVEGTSVIDADQVVEECRDIISQLVEFAGKKDLLLSAVAMDSFASSLILVDEQGQALTPAITYADSRCAPYVEKLREQVDERAYHERTGVRLHTSYHPARLKWVQEEMPELWERTALVMTIGEYVYARLAGIRGLATSTAAWSGIIRVEDGGLDTEILSAVGVGSEYFSPIFDPDQPAFASHCQWEPLAHIPWFHAIPDGWPSNVGPGATDEHTVAVAAATSGAMRVIVSQCPEKVPPGLWCYRLSSRRWILGGALNDVGRAVSWMERTLAPVEASELETALAAPPQPETPQVLPFFSGERATGWAADTKASIVNLTDDSTAVDIWRGVMEGIALSYRRVWDEMMDGSTPPQRVVASGRVTIDHPTWLHVLADSLQCPVIPLEMKRATLRGTALLALDVIDSEGKRAVPPYGDQLEPVAEHAKYYEQLLEEFKRRYSFL